MNHELTRFQSNSKPSCIDHVICNVPGHVDNIQTVPGIVSDHFMIMCLFHTEILKENHMYMWKTEWWRINAENLTEMILQNEMVMGILKSTNQNIIWSNLITGLNQVINLIAPTRIVQCKNDYLPYFGKEVEEQIKEVNNQLEIAIKTQNQGE